MSSNPAHSRLSSLFWTQKGWGVNAEGVVCHHRAFGGLQHHIQGSLATLEGPGAPPLLPHALFAISHLPGTSSLPDLGVCPSSATPGCGTLSKPCGPQFPHLFEATLPNRRRVLHFDGVADGIRGLRGDRGGGGRRNTGGGPPQATHPCLAFHHPGGVERNLTDPVSKPAPCSVLGKVSAPPPPPRSRDGRVLRSGPLLPEDTGTWAEGGQGGGSTSAQPVWSISDNERSVQRAGRAWQRPGSSWGQAQLPAPTPDKERPGPGELAAFPPLGAPGVGVGGVLWGGGRRGLCLTPPLPPPARPQLGNSVSRRQGWRA